MMLVISEGLEINSLFQTKPLIFKFCTHGKFYCLPLTEAKAPFCFRKMVNCYVVFKGKKSGIYMTWHECSEQVLVVKNSVYKKNNDYDHAVSDFTASCQALTVPPLLLEIDTYPAHPDLDDEIASPPLLLQPDTCAAHHDLDGKSSSWKNMAIVTLLILVLGMWLRLSMCNKCK